jgi:hypothetical protein
VVSVENRKAFTHVISAVLPKYTNYKVLGISGSINYNFITRQSLKHSELSTGYISIKIFRASPANCVLRFVCCSEQAILSLSAVNLLIPCNADLVISVR